MVYLFRQMLILPVFYFCFYCHSIFSLAPNSFLLSPELYQSFDIVPVTEEKITIEWNSPKVFHVKAENGRSYIIKEECETLEEAIWINRVASIFDAPLKTGTGDSYFYMNGKYYFVYDFTNGTFMKRNKKTFLEHPLLLDSYMSKVVWSQEELAKKTEEVPLEELQSYRGGYSPAQTFGYYAGNSIDFSRLIQLYESHYQKIHQAGYVRTAWDELYTEKLHRTLLSQLNLLRRHLPQKVHASLPRQIIHGDLKLGNMYINSEETEVTKVFYFTSSTYSPRIETFNEVILYDGANLYDYDSLVACIVHYQNKINPRLKLSPVEILLIPEILRTTYLSWFPGWIALDSQPDYSNIEQEYKEALKNAAYIARMQLELEAFSTFARDFSSMDSNLKLLGDVLRKTGESQEVITQVLSSMKSFMLNPSPIVSHAA